MGDSKRRPLLDGLTDEERGNIPLLLERVYWALGGELDTFCAGIKGVLGQYEQRMKGLEEAVEQMQRCPCQGVRDPDWRCPLLEMAQELGKVKRRLAWLNGSIALLTLMLPTLGWLAMRYWR